MRKKYWCQTQSGWSNSQVNSLSKYKSKLFDVQQQFTADKIMLKESNSMSFYDIVPKDELPKNLQKMSFQTLNTKQLNVGTVIKVFKKQKLNKNEFKIRKVLRENGQIMLLSEIYDYLDDPLQSQKIKQAKLRNQVIPLSNVINQLDEWQKISNKKNTLDSKFSKLRYPSMIMNEQRRSSSHKKQFAIKKFKIGSDYRSEIQKNLDIISTSHNNQQNLMSRYILIQNSSKLLKKQLQQMKEIVQKQIQQKMKKLMQSRKQHHRLYQQKLRLQIQEQQLDQQKAKEEGTGGSALQNAAYAYHVLNQNNIKTVFEDKKNQIQKNETKILKIKKNIEFLEDQTLKNQEQLKNIILAETTYYKISLKKGIDCRDTGLVWIIKKLGLQEGDIPQIEFPTYLDKKSRSYLVAKSKNQDTLEELLKQKRQFVNQIGKQKYENEEPQRRCSISKISSRRSSIKLQKPFQKIQQFDGIKQIINGQCDNDIPKRYSRSAKKITALRQQFVKNENLLRLTQSRGGFKFGYNLNGLTGKQIYNVIGQKIKQVDFSKLKKQKIQQKNDKIYQYQAILRKIQDLHMLIEEQDIQHESHLLSQFRDSKQLFFTIAAACFGIKRAYSLIIKNFSWKNTN